MNIVKYFSLDLIKQIWILKLREKGVLSDILNISKMSKICEMKANILLRFFIWNICKQSTLHL